tara:strand:- start:42 stop:659 length:618 start_codon:yes stop_codon:yes gene_type:complete
MGLNDYFDKIYCINLDKRTDRWKESTDEFKKWDISGVTRYSAVDGSLLNINTNLLAGEIGILKTHIDILNEAIDNEYGSILLIEDDIMFTDEILSLDKHMSLLPSKWDMIYFGGNHNIHMGQKVDVITDGLIKLHNTYGLQCVAIHNRVFKLLLDTIINLGKPVDVYYADIQKTNYCFGFYPSIAYQRPGFSDIQGMNTDNRWIM